MDTPPRSAGARVLCTRAVAPAAQRLLTDAGASVDVARDTRSDTLAAAARHADVIIVRDPLPAGIFAAAPRVRGAIRHGTGLDMIPVDEAARAGVIVVQFPGRNATAVAEHVVMVTLALLRSLLDMDHALRSAGWVTARSHADTSHELGSRTVGVVGTGAVARATRRIIADGFGATVIACGSGIDRVPAEFQGRTFDELLAESDILVLACTLTERTRGLIDSAALNRMRPGAILVNVARGALVVQDALLAAVDTGHLAGAALDVYEDEPLPDGHPYLHQQRLLLTPHTAGLTSESGERLGLLAARAALDILDGRRPEGVVDPPM